MARQDLRRPLHSLYRCTKFMHDDHLTPSVVSVHTKAVLIRIRGLIATQLVRLARLAVQESMRSCYLSSSERPTEPGRMGYDGPMLCDSMAIPLFHVVLSCLSQPDKFYSNVLKQSSQMTKKQPFHKSLVQGTPARQRQTIRHHPSIGHIGVRGAGSFSDGNSVGKGS